MSQRREKYIDILVLALGIAGMAAVVADAPLTWAHLRNGLTLTGLTAHSPIGTVIPGVVSPSHLQWLLDAGIAVIYSVGGTAALTALFFLASAAACALALVKRPQRGLLFTAIAAIAIAPALHPFIGAQGSGVSFLCAFALFGILDRWDTKDSHWIWALPLLYLFWSWCTPLALPTLIFPVLSLLLPRTHPTSRHAMLTFLFAILLCGVATLLPPNGLHGWSEVLFPVANPQGTNIVFGGASPDFHSWDFRIVEVIAAVFATVLGFRSTRTLRMTGIFIGCVILFFQASEYLVILVAFMIPLYGTVLMEGINRLGESFPATKNHGTHGVRSVTFIGSWIVRVAVAIGGVVFVGQMLQVHTALERDLPLAALRTANSVLPEGTVLYTPLPWASATAAGYTKGTVTFTGDSTTFTTRELEDYNEIHLVESSWKSTIADQHITAAIIPTMSQEASLFNLLGWHMVCMDGVQQTELVRAPSLDSVHTPHTSHVCQ